MNCAYHVDREVHGICSTCGRPVCSDCIVDLNGQVFCKPCLEVKVRKPLRQIRGGTRFILSIVPGLGHLYMGLFNRGIQFLGAAVLGTTLLNILTHMGGLVWAVMVFLSIFDAREAHLRIMQGLEVEDKGFVDLKTMSLTWNPKYIGYGLIGIGAIAMYNTLVHDMLRVILGNNPVYWDMINAIDGVVIGGLAVVGGLWLLRKDFRRDPE